MHVFPVRNSDNEIVGYSINQESVDLNSYLYAEKAFLMSMVEELGYDEDVAKYEKEAEYVRDYINTNMYDEETGFYYDLQTNEDGSEKEAAGQPRQGHRGLGLAVGKARHAGTGRARCREHAGRGQILPPGSVPNRFSRQRQVQPEHLLERPGLAGSGAVRGRGIAELRLL